MASGFGLSSKFGGADQFSRFLNQGSNMLQRVSAAVGKDSGHLEEGFSLDLEKVRQEVLFAISKVGLELNESDSDLNLIWNLGGEPSVEEVQRALFDAANRIIGIRYDDLETHQRMVGYLMEGTSERLGWSDWMQHVARVCGDCHDVGKLAFDPKLIKFDTVYTPAQIKEMRGHVNEGVKFFEDIGVLPFEVLQGVADHHERLNGSGYPNSKTRSEISNLGLLIGAIDPFHAMIDPHRKYWRGSLREVLTVDEAVDDLRQKSDKFRYPNSEILHNPLYDKDIVEVFAEFVRELNSNGFNFTQNLKSVT